MRWLWAALICSLGFVAAQDAPAAPFERLVIIKVDGLNADLLYDTMARIDPATGKSALPWMYRVFEEQGVIFDNFYVRGISLSAPSWSILDTGQHAIIRGNAEFDRYTGEVYDYLNVFPFYIGYARNKALDMPGVEVLDRAGIPLVIDRFPYAETLQSFQLFQRGVSWTTLKDALLRSVSGNSLRALLESAAPVSLSSSLSKQVEEELADGLQGERYLYLDLFTGDVDHTGHATNDPTALLRVLKQVDGLIGRVAMAIRQGPMAQKTLLVVVSDHGMNNVPGVISQTFNLPDLFGSKAGGGHHVVTDREQLSDYKLRGINPLVHRVITPSPQSLYLAGEASHYPTAWMDIDGNERAALHLRNSDLNKVHILLIALARTDLKPDMRRAAALSLQAVIGKHRRRWQAEVDQMTAELDALDEAIKARKELVKQRPVKGADLRETGEDKVNRRLRLTLEDWQREHESYAAYVDHLKRLLALKPDAAEPFKGHISELIPELALGDNNSVDQLQHYIAGPAADGLVVGSDGMLDDEKSFVRIDYFALLANQRAKNNPQGELSRNPIDFIATPLPEAQRAYWLYADKDHQLMILQNERGQLRLEPVREVRQDPDGVVRWLKGPWIHGLPLMLFEDDKLHVSGDRGAWLSEWHTEREWMKAIEDCRYSNGVIGVTEELSPVGPLVPGPPGISSQLLAYERMRREVVQADFHIFAADHWNFNARFPNPGGNHGSFLRISTHSVWMMSGASLRTQHVKEPYDSLSFASTVLQLVGKSAPMPDRVVDLH